MPDTLQSSPASAVLDPRVDPETDITIEMVEPDPATAAVQSVDPVAAEAVVAGGASRCGRLRGGLRGGGRSSRRRRGRVRTWAMRREGCLTRKTGRRSARTAPAHRHLRPRAALAGIISTMAARASASPSRFRRESDSRNARAPISAPRAMTPMFMDANTTDGDPAAIGARGYRSDIAERQPQQVQARERFERQGADRAPRAMTPINMDANTPTGDPWQRLVRADRSDIAEIRQTRHAPAHGATPSRATEVAQHQHPG